MTKRYVQIFTNIFIAVTLFSFLHISLSQLIVGFIIYLALKAAEGFVLAYV